MLCGNMLKRQYLGQGFTCEVAVVEGEVLVLVG
jgi:hypothetical protein